jgi:hypothetical protein
MGRKGLTRTWMLWWLVWFRDPMEQASTCRRTLTRSQRMLQRRRSTARQQNSHFSQQTLHPDQRLWAVKFPQSMMCDKLQSAAAAALAGAVPHGS